MKGSTETTVSPTVPPSITSVTTTKSEESTTFVTKTHVFKWNLVGYPFASSLVRSEDFVTSEEDSWFLQLDPPKLRVDKGLSSDINNTVATMYSTSPIDMQSMVTASGFEYWTECKLSLVLKSKGCNNYSTNKTLTRRNINSIQVNGRSNQDFLSLGFEISLATASDPDKSLHSWVSFSEPFSPMTKFASRIFPFKGKLPDLVTVHKLTNIVINCQLFYKNNLDNNKNGVHFQMNNSLLNNEISLLQDKNSLLADMRCLFSDQFAKKLGTDVTLVGVDGCIEVHKLILVARSVVFRDVLEAEQMHQYNNRDNNRGSDEIKIVGVCLRVLKMFVAFLYTDQVTPESDFKEYHVELLLLADKYKIPKLRLLCENSVARSLNEDNCPEIASLTRTVKSTIIQRKLNDFFNQ